MKDKKIALITGGNKGIGFECVRQLSQKNYITILGARNIERGLKAKSKLLGEGLENIFFHQIDLERPEHFKSLFEEIDKHFGKLDVLINNAGIMEEKNQQLSGRQISVMETPLSVIEQSFKVNILGTLELTRTLIPLISRSNRGRILNVSSKMGCLTEMNGGYPAYRTSKASLNALTRIFADESAQTNICVNSVCPGWTKTDMGGPGAHREVSDSSSKVLDILEKNETGKFYFNGKLSDW